MSSKTTFFSSWYSHIWTTTHRIVLRCIMVLYCIIMYRIVSYRYCIVSYRYCIVLYCIVLHVLVLLICFISFVFFILHRSLAENKYDGVRLWSRVVVLVASCRCDTNTYCGLMWNTGNSHLNLHGCYIFLSLWWSRLENNLPYSRI